MNPEEYAKADRAEANEERVKVSVEVKKEDAVKQRSPIQDVYDAFLALKVDNFINNLLGYHRKDLHIYQGKIIFLLDSDDAKSMRTYIDFVHEMEGFGFKESQLVSKIRDVYYPKQEADQYE